MLVTALCVMLTGTPAAEGNMDYSEAEEIVYEFTDSSVPPQYHRSYTIRVMRDSVHVTVDSYGEILAEAGYPITGSDHRELMEALETAGLHLVPERENDGCTGGTTETLTILGAEGTVFHGWVYHCGGRDYGTMEGDVALAAEAFRALVPDLETLKR